MMLDLIPQKRFSTSRNTDGVFIGTRSGISYVTGPPLEVWRFDLAKDNPGWLVVDPRDVDFTMERLVLALLDRRSGRQDPARGRIRSKLRTFSHLRCLHSMIGSRVRRAVHRLPAVSKPYLQIWLAHRVPEFLQLVETVPMIASMVTANLLATHIPAGDLPNIVAEVSKLKRHKILEMNGFAAETLRGFSKVLASAADPQLLPSLRTMLQDRLVRKRWNHASAIGADAIRFFADDGLMARVTGRFLRLVQQIDTYSREPSYSRWLKNLLPLLRLLDREHGRRKFDTPYQLEELYFGDIDWDMFEAIRHLHFPPAPWEGVPGVFTQLSNGEDLLLHAVRLGQCIGNAEYINLLCDEKIYLFRGAGFGVPPCTIQINIEREGGSDFRHYVITEIAGKNNAKLPPSALAAIQVWAENSGVTYPARTVARSETEELF